MFGGGKLGIPGACWYAVLPAVDCGRFPAKRAIRESVAVEADVFADGHNGHVVLIFLLLYFAFRSVLDACLVLVNVLALSLGGIWALILTETGQSETEVVMGASGM